jgi:hypothetical protein
LKSFTATVEEHPDWGAVMLFYSALHLLEQTFAYDNHHNRTHPDREYHIKKNCSSIWPAYHRLQNESLKARYMQGGIFSMNAKGVQGELHAIHFKKIAEFASARIASRGATTAAPKNPPTK